MDRPAIRAIVVDDEPLGRRNVIALLGRDPDVELVGEAASGGEALSVIARARPDVIFLDVQMPEVNGFDVLDRLGPGLTAEVVFVTAYDTYAVQAFEAGALDYLLKPFDDERFAIALERVKSRLAGSAAAQDPRVFVKTARQISLVRLADVDWIEAADYYACLHVAGRAHMIRRTIRQLERELDPAVFCRIHRSTIVNLGRVRGLALNGAGDSDVVLDGETRLRVSRRYRRRIEERLRARSWDHARRGTGS